MAFLIDLLLKPSIQLTMDRLYPKESFKEFAILIELDGNLAKLKTTMLLIRSVLHDAQHKQITNPAVEEWLQQLTHLAYDIDDLFDKLNTDARRLKLAKEHLPHANQVQEFLSSLCQFWSNATQINKIKVLTERLDQVAKQRQDLGLSQGVAESSVRISQRPLTGSLVNRSHIYGREKDVEQTLELLSSDATGNSNFSVTSIVGLGGVGKTTLAQLLYNHEKLKYLKPRGWVCVSDGRFDVTRITKAIIESITGTSPDLTELQPLQDRLMELLNEKKFLIVLDDVWTTNTSDWGALRAPFEVGCRGSKIIVTTRSTKVSRMMASVHTYQLNKLSEEGCRSLFNHHAFENGSPDEHPELKPIREKIVEKCDGLPLAAKALGGLLCGTMDIAEWELILNSKIWDLPEDESGILPSLKVSYHYLSSNLKQCFCYCAIFPQDHVFDKKELIQLWMAEGFLQPQGHRRMEDVGDDYFRELFSRSFFQPHSEARGFVMHDLIHDLARYVSRTICFYLKGRLEGDNPLGNKVSLVRYALFPTKEYEVMSTFKVLHEAKNVRTLLLKLSGPFSYVPKGLPQYLFSRLQCLRVLRLSKISTNFEVPESMGDLTHLRYLDLSKTHIINLPASLSTLFNLQTLLLRDCPSLVDLVSDMGNLTELRHLDIHGCSKLARMPSGMDKLTNLQTLTFFVVGAGCGSGIEGLEHIKQLHESLCIAGLKNVGKICGSILRNKEHLDELELDWRFSMAYSQREDVESVDEATETAVIEKLQPHTNLKSLTVKRFCATRFPHWLGNSSYSALVNLKLVDCKGCQLLPPLGCLPSLRNLLIQGLWKVKTVGAEFYGGVRHASRLPFQSLEELVFKDMQDWEEWFGIDKERGEVFPHLRELQIDNCPKLKKFSHSFVKLQKLKIKDCPKVIELPRRLPMLCRLEVEKCEAMVLRSIVDAPPPPLSFLRICGISNLKNLLVPLEEGGRPLMGYLDSLEELEIRECHELVKLLSSNGVRRGTQCLASLRTLKIIYCTQLACLSDHEDELPLRSLTHLEIKDCRSLHFLKFPSTLEIVKINDCDSLSTRMIQFDSFRELTIDYWPCFECSEEKIDVPSTLRKFFIFGCMSLKTFPALMTHSNNDGNDAFLDDLTISSCRNLESFATIGASSSTRFPLLPKCLRIEYCEKLLVLPESMMCSNRFLEYLEITSCDKITSLPEGIHELTSLRFLRIKWCHSLVSFPNAGLPTTTLKSFEICDCKSLQSLPDCLGHATSLESLSIIECPNLDPFPEGGFPYNLKSLKILSCVKEKPISEWGLHNLTSLTTLAIGGFVGVVYLPKCLLPLNITFLHIENLPDLQYLPEGFHSLVSLERLSIKNCEKLESLPEEGLPPSLAKLRVAGCPMLEQRCAEEKGEDWPKIAHISFTEIPDKYLGRFRVFN